MPREYRDISQYVKEIYELHEQGINLTKIEKKNTILLEQKVHNIIYLFIGNYNICRNAECYASS